MNSLLKILATNFATQNTIRPCCKLARFANTPRIQVSYISSEKCGGDDTKHDCPNQNCEKSENDSFRHMYHPDCEAAINEQIAAELNAAYAYLDIASTFDRTCLALPGAKKFFQRMREEELEHAQKFINYQNMRGGKVVLCPISTVSCKWTIEKALEVSLELEKIVKEKLIKVHDCAEKHRDLAMMDMIVEFISEQDRSICEFGRLLSRYKQMGCKMCGCTDFLFDRELLKAMKKSPDDEFKYM